MTFGFTTPPCSTTKLLWETESRFIPRLPRFTQGLALQPSDERYNTKFIVLAESVRHHIKEEESEMFPKAEDCEIDWDALCSQVVKRKEQLIAKTSATSKTSQDKASIH